MNYYAGPDIWADSLEQPKHRKMYRMCGTWNVRSIYKTGSLTAAAEELSKYKLHLIGCIQQIP